MPENDPTDPFAELYRRLPDPRTGAMDATARGDEAAGDDRPETPQPPSRRAAREARRAQTGPTPASGSDTRDDAAPAAPAGPVPAARHTAPAEPVSAARPAAPAEPVPTPRPAAPAFEHVARSSEQPAAPRTAAPASSAREPEPARRSSPVHDREPALVGVAAAGGSGGSRPPASGSLEDLFAGRASTDEVRGAARPPRRRRRTGAWVALAIVLVLVGGIVGGGVALWNTYGERVQAFFGAGEPTDFEPGMATGEARVTIVSGDTGESVSPKLFEAGVTKASDSLYRYMVENAVVFTFQPGVYRLQQQMTSAAVLEALGDPANRLDNSVQLREGLTLDQSLDVIAEQLSMPREDLDVAVADPSQYGVPAATLEGWIFPATYDFDEGVTATDVIGRMVQRTVQSLDQAGVPEADRERILIVASIIEREARNRDDFYKVSRVIENRLQPGNQETFGKLEMDSTVQYGANELGSGSVSTSTEARNSDNPWNTYMYPGLPIGPIANPGDLAIDAAMKPVDGPWLYFVTVNLDTGETVFTSTYSEHEQAVAQWRAWCAENPDGGC
ncbi:endolytic transglycosylase MltG [Microbacterium sp. ACRRU]|uniref:endolytic transglycosylase MltG n=1 Tax=Microbacterium sp. ACRRU TaxID=2918204 RepID=UPI001EF4FB2A|nr:endolytic transglycosylase MltG [Microbacterium sp. ACRRU]MCG7417178.1 endolytic transglycosylase MltG [Microbacterium sp. ACRRU]